MKVLKSLEKLARIECVGLVFKPDSLKTKKTYEEIIAIFTKAHLEVIVEQNSALMLHLPNGMAFDEMCQKVDFIVCVGGDGTLISAVRRSFKYGKAVLGVHLGTLGFLTDIMPQELEQFIEKLKMGNYRIDNRMMISGSARNQEFVAFNDIVISSKTIANMIRIDAKIDGKLFNSYYGDGLIISTPTGSTAYNLSAGGPVVFPLTDAFIVTPVAAHSLTQRPLVLPVDFEIEFKIADTKGAVAIVDGQDMYELQQNQSVKIAIASNKAKLIHRCERNYFEVLNKKLQWGN
jgi:NAD+ kinase